MKRCHRPRQSAARAAETVWPLLSAVEVREVLRVSPWMMARPHLAHQCPAPAKRASPVSSVTVAEAGVAAHATRAVAVAAVAAALVRMMLGVLFGRFVASQIPH